MVYRHPAEPRRLLVGEEACQEGVGRCRAMAVPAHPDLVMPQRLCDDEALKRQMAILQQEVQPSDAELS